MSMNEQGPLAPIRVPVERAARHPLLRLALVPTDLTTALEWPGLTFEQKGALEGVHLIAHRGVISIPPRVNVDFLVDDDTDPEAPPFFTGRAPDLQRFYTRFTDTGFLHVGTYTAITLDGIRRYFMWAVTGWSEIGLDMFVYYRDDDDTHFAETSRDDLDELAPGAVAAAAVRATAPAPVDELGDFRDRFLELGTDDPMYAGWRAAMAAEASSADEKDEDEDGDDEEGDEVDFMTELDAIVQHGRASAIASIAHRTQVDKLGYDYIDHSARVAESFDWLDEPVAHCAAWLHDVVEDSDITAKDLLAAGMLPEIVEVVELLTRRDDVPDAEYYERIRQNPIARAVKLADIADNEAEWRFRKLDFETQARLSQRYFKARRLLEQDPS